MASEASNTIVDGSSVADEAGVLTKPQQSEMSTLTNSIIEWRRLKDESTELKQQAREMGKKMRVLEESIVRIMKSHNIGALDLKSSGGRVLFKKQKRQAGLGQKNMLKLIAAHLKSEEKATELMKYVQEHREVVMKESIHYEKAE
jgi:hypothetical protein